MEKINQRDKQTLHFLKWIRQYSGWWYLICTPEDEHMNADMMKMLVKRLAKEQLYELIFVLLMVHRKAKFMEHIFHYLLLEIVIQNWRGEVKTKNQIFEEIVNLLE